jgi:Flp pilus assembly protein CpaB
MTYRTRNILIASGLALLAVVFVMVYISKVRNDADLGRQLVSVFVAARDIPEGTPGSKLGSTSLLEKQIPRKAVVPGAISEVSQVDGLIATQETLAGEQVTARRFGPLAASGVRSELGKKERAFQLAGEPSQVLDGTLKAGDHVDVLGTWNVPENCTNCHVSRVIVRDALVLKTSSDLASDSGVGSSDTVPIQLRLNDSEAEKVLWMDANGEWTLVLRPVLKPRNSVQGYENDEFLLQDGRQRRGPSR